MIILHALSTHFTRYRFTVNTCVRSMPGYFWWFSETSFINLYFKARLYRNFQRISWRRREKNTIRFIQFVLTLRSSFANVIDRDLVDLKRVYINPLRTTCRLVKTNEWGESKYFINWFWLVTQIQMSCN